MHNASLARHIGWGSEPLTRALRAAQGAPGQEIDSANSKQGPAQTPPTIVALQSRAPQRLTKTTSDGSPPPSLIKLHPDIAVALLRQQLAAPGRLWLLLRHIDAAGRGWIDIAEARRQLCEKRSPLRVVGWRQMRKLLGRGDGLFWQRDKRRLWLRSPLKVAAALGIERFLHRPVGVPAAVLLQGIGHVRAHFYASFHSSRTPDEEKPSRPMPIARATLQEICQTSRRTLSQYERRAGVKKQKNLAIGKTHTLADFQNQAWQRGRAVFQINDRGGRLGQEGATYTAWQLPNSYLGPHKKQPKGRQKRMNRKLADLFTKGMTGNGKPGDLSRETNGDGERRFFDNGVTAAAAYNRGPDHDLYWRDTKYGDATTGGAVTGGAVTGGAGRSQLWHWLPPQRDQRRHQRASNAAPRSAFT